MKAITNPVNTKIKFGVSEQILEVKGLKTSISGQSMDWKLSEKEDKKNKVQTINDQSTEVEYPSAKAVYESLQNLPIPEQVQADWNQIDTEAPDYIKNKPNLATVATSGSYTDLSDKPTIPVVPTNVSAFTNDAGYITSSQVPAQVQSDWSQTDNQAVDYIKNKPSIPSAQVNSDWNATSGVAEILNKPTIPVVPTNVSAFTNDAGYITLSDVPAQVQADWNQSDNTQVDYIKNKPTIPAAQVQSDWNQSDNQAVDYIKNKPTIPASPVQSNWNESDSSSLAYIQNKPTIPAAQVNSDWNASSGVAEILHKPTIPVVAQSITSGDTGYTTGDQVYQVVGNVESLLLALRGNV